MVRTTGRKAVLFLAALALAPAMVVGAQAKGASYDEQMRADRAAIAEKIQLYGLLHDGDGQGASAELWAETIFTEDASFQVLWPDGSAMVPASPAGISGRARILRIFNAAMPSPDGRLVRHLLGNPVFDSISANEARTRTIEQVLRGPAILPFSSEQGGTPTQLPIDVYVFHDTWRKELDGQWRKSKSLIYCVLNCLPFTIPDELLHD